MGRKIAIWTLRSLILLGAMSASAHGPGMGRMGRPDGMGPGAGAGFGGRMAAELGLSADQQKQITDLRTKLETELGPVWTQLQTKQSELEALWATGTPDRNTLLAKVSEIDTLRDQTRTAHIDFRLAALQVLTPDQRTKAISMMHGPGKDHHGPHGMMDPAGQSCPCATPPN